MIKKAISWFLVLLNTSICLIVLWTMWKGKILFFNAPQAIEYKDFVAILLTSLGVMIAIATILIAALAIWGFEALKEEARKTARETVSIQSTRNAADSSSLSNNEAFDISKVYVKNSNDTPDNSAGLNKEGDL